MRSFLITCLQFFSGLILFSQILSAAVIDFEGLSDGTPLTNQYPGLTFTNVQILTTGISLNEFESPPHSGTHAAAATSGGPITITFSTPQSAFSGFFSYSGPITLTAYNSSNAVLATTHSAFTNNLLLSGVGGGSPNELLGVIAPGMTRLTIAGASDFALDDVLINSVLPPNVSGQVSVTQNGFVRNRSTGIWSSTMTVTNTSATAIAGPIQVVLSNLSPNARMVNNSGILGGNPFITVQAGALASKASASVSIQFTNPSSGIINFTTITYSGAL